MSLYGFYCTILLNALDKDFFKMNKRKCSRSDLPIFKTFHFVKDERPCEDL